MSDQTCFSLKTVGFSDIEKQNFESILTIASRKLNAKWHIVDDADVDCYLVSDGFANDLNYREKFNELPINRCIFYCQTPLSGDVKSLYVNGHRIPKLNELVQLFNQMAERRRSVAELVEKNSFKIAINTSNGNLFDASQGLLGILLEKPTCALLLQFSSDFHSAQILLPADQSGFYSPLAFDCLWPYVETAAEVNAKPLTQEAVKQWLTEESCEKQPLSKLLWALVLKTANGRKPKFYDEQQAVCLKRWPDMSLPGSRQFVQLAGFMTSNAATLEQVSQRTGMALGKVYDFYNACYALNLVENVHNTTFCKATNTDRHVIIKIAEHLQQYGLS